MKSSIAFTLLGLIVGATLAFWLLLENSSATPLEIAGLPTQHSTAARTSREPGPQRIPSDRLGGPQLPFARPASGIFQENFLLSSGAAYFYRIPPESIPVINAAIAKTGRRAREQRIEQAVLLKGDDEEVLLGAPRNPSFAAKLEAELRAVLVTNGMPPEVAATEEYREWFHGLTDGLTVDDASYIVRSAAQVGAGNQSMLISVKARPGANPTTSIRYFTRVSDLSGFERELLEKRLPVQFRARRGL